MVREHYLSAMPSGVVELCADWFDEPCPIDDAAAVAERAAEQRPYFTEDVIGGCLIWLKSRLVERGVLRALARELNQPDGTLPLRDLEQIESRPVKEWTPEEWKRIEWAMKWKNKHLGHSNSHLSRSPLASLSPINRVAARVAEFENRQPCPYCNRWHRNGAALRLHIIDNHLQEYQE